MDWRLCVQHNYWWKLFSAVSIMKTSSGCGKFSVLARFVETWVRGRRLSTRCDFLNQTSPVEPGLPGFPR